MGTLTTTGGLAGAMDGVSARWNSGTTVTYPVWEFRTAADAVLATITMQTTTCAAANSDGTCNVNPPNGESDWNGLGSGYEFTASATGTVAKAVCVNRDQADIFEQTVGTSGADITVNTTSWVNGNTYRITAVPTLDIS